MLWRVVGPEVEEGLGSGNTGSVCSWTLQFDSRCEEGAGALHVYMRYWRVRYAYPGRFRKGRMMMWSDTMQEDAEA